MSPPSLKALRLLACVFSLSLAAGCADACLSLANQICSCQLDDNSRAACSAQAKAAEATFAVRTADEEFCQKKLDSNACNCNQTSTAARTACCNRLNTPEGRDACGLVITSPAP